MKDIYISGLICQIMICLYIYILSFEHYIQVIKPLEILECIKLKILNISKK